MLTSWVQREFRFPVTRSMPIAGVQIDAGAGAVLNDVNRQYSIFANGANLYAGLVQQNGLLRFQIWKSTDDGQTWMVQDDANSPPWSGIVWFDQAGGVAYVVAVDGAHVPPQSRMGLYSFDCATDTWSVIDTNGPQCQNLSQIFRRADNSFYVVYDAGNPITPGKVGSTRLWGVVWNGAAWVDDTDIGAASGLTGASGATSIFAYVASATVDATGRMHVFYFNPTYTQFWYQAIEATNLLGASHQFLEPIQALDNAVPLGTPVVIGNLIVCGAAFTDGLTSYGGVLVGTGLSAPAWSSNQKIDATPEVDKPPQAFYDSGTGTLAVFITAYSGGDPAGVLRVAQTLNLANPLVDWTAQNYYVLGVDITPPGTNLGFGMLVVEAGPGTALLIGSAFIGFNNTAFYIGSLPFTGLPSTLNSRIDAASMRVLSLPRLQYLDAAGAAKQCFPLKKRC